jgi:hypothetical protein
VQAPPPHRTYKWGDGAHTPIGFQHRAWRLPRRAWPTRERRAAPKEPEVISLAAPAGLEPQPRCRSPPPGGLGRLRRLSHGPPAVRAGPHRARSQLRPSPSTTYRRLRPGCGLASSARPHSSGGGGVYEIARLLSELPSATSTMPRASCRATGAPHTPQKQFTAHATSRQLDPVYPPDGSMRSMLGASGRGAAPAPMTSSENGTPLSAHLASCSRQASSMIAGRSTSQGRWLLRARVSAALEPPMTAASIAFLGSTRRDMNSLRRVSWARFAARLCRKSSSGFSIKPVNLDFFAISVYQLSDRCFGNARRKMWRRGRGFNLRLALLLQSATKIGH